MKKILLVFLCCISASFGQNGIIGSGFTDGWSDSNIIYFDDNAGSSRGKILNPKGTGNQFFRMVRGWDSNLTQFGPFGCSDVNWTDQSGVKYENMPSCGSGAFFINCPNTTDHYVFKTPNGPTSTSFVYFRVQGTIRTVTSVNRTPSTVFVGQSANIEAVLSGALPTGQGVYIRYTKDNYVTSIVTEMTGSGTSYNFTLPADYNTANANVSYYVFTSGSGLTITSADADWYTINLNNNGGANFNYTVDDTWTTQSGATDWSNVSSWVNGSVPTTGAKVNINHDLTLDVNAIVSNVSIATTKRLTTAVSTTLQVSGTVSVVGTGAITVNGTLQLNSGANISVAPTYGEMSTLVYNNGGSITRANEWPGINSPASVVIQNNTILTLQDARSIKNDFILQGGGEIRTTGEQTITMNGTNQNIQVTTGGKISGTDNGFGNNLTLTIQNGSTTQITGDATSDNDNERKFFNINVLSGGALTLSRGVLCRYGTFTVEGSLMIKANGYVQSSIIGATPVTYGNSSVLVYDNGGTYTTTNFEWPSSDGPNNVTIQNSGTQVTLNGSKTINGVLTLANGTLTNGTNLTMGNNATIVRTGGVMSATPLGTSYNVTYGPHTAGLTTGVELPSSATVLNNLTITNGHTIDLADSKVVNGNVIIDAQTHLQLSDKTLNRNSAGGSFTMGENATLTIGSTQSFPSNYTVYALNETSTTHYNGSEQTVSNLNNNAYGNLILSNTGVKNLATDVEVATDLILQDDVQVTVQASNSITVGGALKRLDDAEFTVQSDGNLIQLGSANDNEGEITVKRSALIKRLDMTLWSSPVSSQNLLDFSPETLINRFFVYDESTNGWIIQDDVANHTMSVGQGYAVRAPNDWSTSPAAFVGSFLGVPNSGDISISLASSHPTARFNLIGNPYPSTLNLRALYNANSTKIENKFYVYEHTLGSPTPSGQTNYGVLTIAPDVNDNVYITASDSNNEGSEDVFALAESVQAGQGFFIKALEDASGTIDFSNDMRGKVAGVFFRNSELNEVESSSFRLKLSGPDGFQNQAVVGFYDYASDGIDMMDTKGIGSPLYTIANNENYVIQGRALPFDQTTVIPLGFRVGVDGNFEIQIISSKGIFVDQQNVLLHDTQLGVYHNISQSAYQFNTLVGTHNDRFHIVFVPTLSINNPSFDDNPWSVFVQNETLQLVALSTQIIENIEVFDVNGRLLYGNSNINQNRFSFTNLNPTQSVVIIKGTTTTGQVFTQKVKY